MENWLTAPWSSIFETVVSALVIFTIILLIVRVAGLRTFAKMSSIDFASTIAMGSVLASVVINGTTSILKGAVALATIVTFQQVFAKLKFLSPGFEELSENSPVLLMEGTHFLEDNMQRVGVSRADLIAKLREANVLRLSEIEAVVFETTGDISVLHQSGDERLEDILLEGVKR